MTIERPRPNKVGARGSVKTIDGGRRRFTILDEIVEQQPVPEKGTRKLIYFQKLRFDDERRAQYRWTYYMIGVKPGARGRWVFGQSSVLVPPKQLRRILAEARRRGWEGA